VALVLPGAGALDGQAFTAGTVLTMLADVMMSEAFEHGGPGVGLLTVPGYLAAAMLSSRSQVQHDNWTF
jgi:ZIP family zinc transporter